MWNVNISGADSADDTTHREGNNEKNLERMKREAKRERSGKGHQ